MRSPPSSHPPEAPALILALWSLALLLTCSVLINLIQYLQGLR